MSANPVVVERRIAETEIRVEARLGAGLAIDTAVPFLDHGMTTLALAPHTAERLFIPLTIGGGIASGTATHVAEAITRGGADADLPTRELVS